MTFLVETGELYIDAYDLKNSPKEYDETDIKIYYFDNE